MSPLLFSLSSVIFTSLISIVLIYLLLKYIPRFSRVTVPLVSLAVGSLFGDAFLHIIPEAFAKLSGHLAPFLIIVGIVIFFLIEKIVRWRHCHNTDCIDDEDHAGHHSDHIVTNSLVGDFFHNFIDGIIVASSFIVSFQLGLATSLAVLIHEIPQELGDFAIYIHEGRSLRQSLWLNLATAVSSLLGALFTFVIGTRFIDFSIYMLPITAGGFIYLASSDLIPELHRHETTASSAISQVILLLLGVALMASLLLLE